MKKISIEAKATQLREVVVDFIDAVVESEQAGRKALRVLPIEVVSALADYLRTEHVECPRCGGVAKAEQISHDRVCLNCWRVAKEEAQQA